MPSCILELHKCITSYLDKAVVAEAAYIGGIIFNASIRMVQLRDKMEFENHPNVPRELEKSAKKYVQIMIFSTFYFGCGISYIIYFTCDVPNISDRLEPVTNGLLSH